MLEQVITKISGAFKDTLPVHECGLVIQHNPHKISLHSISFFSDQVDRWVSEEERLVAIDANDMWLLKWFPVDPIGACEIYGASLQSVMVAMYQSEVERVMVEEEAKEATKPKLILPNETKLETPKLIV